MFELRVTHTLDLAQLASITAQLTKIISQGETIMATLQEVADDITAETTVIGGISTLIDGLQAQLAAALAGTALSPATQAQVDAIFASAEANKAALAAALLKGTNPVVPTVVPPVTPAP